MESSIKLKETILPLLIPLVPVCFALSPLARAVTPPPDGGYFDFNTAEGEDALFSAWNAGDNTAVGYHALYYSQAWENTAVGANALVNNIIGENNTAVGAFALASSTGASANTAVGFQALQGNTTGQQNTAVGNGTLVLNTSGQSNTAMGPGALFDNSTGTNNTAIGVNTLTGNNADNNTALGVYALLNNGTGAQNTASGGFALYENSSGDNNTADGFNALFNSKGSNNTALGFNALFNNTTGSNNIGLGVGAGANLTTGNDNIDIANPGVAGESNRIRIGTRHTHRATFIAGISGTTVPTGVPVIIDTTGHLGTTTSSARFKDAIKPMDNASEAILGLQPVTFHYKHELDPRGTRQFGLVAEQVEKVNPELVVHDEQGKPYSVRYEVVNAMLLNEFLKAHHKMETQEATIAHLKSSVSKQETTIAKQQKQIEALNIGLQKVSDQLELSKSAPQIVLNNQR
jgi:trimeric autotransporter adhesin